MHQSVDSADVFVYILTHEQVVVNVYNDYFDAVTRAIEEVTGDPETTYVDSFEHVIYVEGDLGLISILVEKVF